MLMHAIAHGGCTDIVRESALQVDSRSKSLAAPGTRTRVSRLLLLAFQSNSLPALAIVSQSARPITLKQFPQQHGGSYNSISHSLLARELAYWDGLSLAFRSTTATKIAAGTEQIVHVSDFSQVPALGKN